MPDYTALAIPGKAGDAGLTEQLRSNMVMFLDWAFLGLGYFMNVTTGTTYPFGGNPSYLRLSDDSRYPVGTAWDCFKTNLVWEQNTDAPSQPISISGVYLNGTFMPLSGGGYYVNYPLGRVVFDSALPSSSTVQAEFSYKYYNIYPETTQWFQQLTQGTWRVNDPQFTAYGSGIWSIFPDSRTQLPAVAVEISPTTKHQPLGLGGGQWIFKDVLIHVFSENPVDRDNFIDILSYQKGKRVFIVDKSAIGKAGAFPLSPYGTLVNPSSTYPELVNQFVWSDFYVSDLSVQRTDNNPQSIYHGVCRWTCKVNAPFAV